MRTDTDVILFSFHTKGVIILGPVTLCLFTCLASLYTGAESFNILLVRELCQFGKILNESFMLKSGICHYITPYYATPKHHRQLQLAYVTCQNQHMHIFHTRLKFPMGHMEILAQTTMQRPFCTLHNENAAPVWPFVSTSCKVDIRLSNYQ